MKSIEWKSAGLCVWCGKPRGIDGTASHCRPCATKSNAALLARKKQRLAEGLCSACYKPRGQDGTSVHCPACADKARNRSNKIATKLKSSNLCAECRNPIDEGGTARLCSTCKGIRNERLSTHRKRWRAERAEAGRCTECGELEQNTKFKLCRSCRTSDNGNPRLVPTGFCHRCNGVLDTKHLGLVNCSECLIKGFISNAGLPANYFSILMQKLRDQEYKCYYTGGCIGSRGQPVYRSHYS